MAPILFFTFVVERWRGRGQEEAVCVEYLTSTASKIPQEKNISEILKLLYPFFKKQIC